MPSAVYKRLAEHLDNLPGGFPPTESGVELRILEKLFTPEEAALAPHLSLLREQAPAIAARAGLGVDDTARLLDQMEHKGLIYGVHPRRGDPYYMAAQFVVGIYEHQVSRLTPELARDMEEYVPALFNPEIWRKAPQLRTVPVGRSITPKMEVMSYETAADLVRAQKRFSVAPCICRQEKELVGHTCDKPIEVCMSFGAGAEYYNRHGLGRPITMEEALAILAKADEAGLVLQPGNARNIFGLCACCGDCCGILTTIKRYPKPGTLISSAFRVAYDADTCTACGICVDRCQMDALRLEGDTILVDLDRCIGCGLCVTTCPSESLTLVRKPDSEQPAVPTDLQETLIRLGMARGKPGVAEMLGVAAPSAQEGEHV